MRDLYTRYFNRVNVLVVFAMICLIIPNTLCKIRILHVYPNHLTQAI